MKLNKKQIPAFIGVVFLGIIIGGFAWELFERLLISLGSTFSLTLDQPFGFDFYVIVLYIRLNIGMAMGLVGSFFLFFKI